MRAQSAFNLSASSPEVFLGQGMLESPVEFLPSPCQQRLQREAAKSAHSQLLQPATFLAFPGFLSCSVLCQCTMLSPLGRVCACRSPLCQKNTGCACQSALLSYVQNKDETYCDLMDAEAGKSELGSYFILSKDIGPFVSIY